MVSHLARLWHCREGSVAPLAALLVTVAAGSAALSIDLGIVYFEKSELQTTADAASLAAATYLPDQAAAKKAALLYAEKNMPAAEHGMVLAEEDVVFGVWDAATRSFIPQTGAPTAVSVILRKTVERGNAVPTVFGKVLGYDTIEVGSSSKSAAVAGGVNPLCVLVLDPADSNAMDVRSNGRINAQGCAAWVNSTAEKALVTAANSEIHFSQTCVAGEHDVDRNAIYQTPPKAHCRPKQDPLRTIAPPTVGACSHNNMVVNKGDKVLDPGVYCGGLKLKPDTTVHLNPGTYVIKDGLFELSSNTVLTGKDVTVYLVGDKARIWFRSNSEVELVAPSTGPLAGIAIFEDREAPLFRDHEFSSNGIKKIEGVIYLPRGTLQIDSNVEVLADSAFTSLIAQRLQLESNARITFNTDYDASTAANVSPRLISLLR